MIEYLRRHLRGRFRGMLQILHFNARQYLLATAILLASLLFVAAAPIPPVLRWAVGLGAAIVFYWMAASLLVSHWVYDRSPLTDWHWVMGTVPRQLHKRVRWVNVHAGFDDTTRKLRAVFRTAPVKVIDLYDAQLMTERSITVARQSSVPVSGTVTAAPDSLPLGDRSVDMVLLLLAAHEIREPRVRKAFFSELHRALRAGGRVVVVEHLRDSWNLLAFGAGYSHFFSRHTWLQLAREAGFVVCSEAKHTPFITSFVLEKDHEPDDACASRGHITAVSCGA